MSNIDMKNVHDNLTNRIKEYIKIIIKEYGRYIPDDVMKKLTSITDYSKILKIYDYGEVNAYASSENIMMPLCADKILNIASKIPGYGINKNHKTYNDDNIVINDNTYFTYIKHIFISGSNAEDYYSDLLLHETMHYCGGNGSTVLKEGMNE